MKRLMLASILMAGLSGAAVADHNSPFGAGWANMPNDVHNMRLDETVSDEEFWDFVQGGGGPIR